MKKKRKLRPYVIPSISIILTLVFSVVAITKFEDIPPEKLDYASNVIMNEDTPVIADQANLIIRPYTNENIKVGKNFYDYQADEKVQNESIVYYENTYFQNSGVDFVLEDVFDVVSILDGTVISVDNNELLGNTIEIKHDNNLISVYQGLSNIVVKENDIITKGQNIGKSGTSKINSELGNHLHFELFKDGQVVNPMEYFNKDLKGI